MTDQIFKPGTKVWLEKPGSRYGNEPTRYVSAVVITQHKNGNVTLDVTGNKQFRPFSDHYKTKGPYLSERGDGHRDAHMADAAMDAIATAGNIEWKQWRLRGDVINHVYRHGKTMPPELVTIIAQWMHAEGWRKP